MLLLRWLQDNEQRPVYGDFGDMSGTYVQELKIQYCQADGGSGLKNANPDPFGEN